MTVDLGETGRDFRRCLIIPFSDSCDLLGAQRAKICAYMCTYERTCTNARGHTQATLSPERFAWGPQFEERGGRGGAGGGQRVLPNRENQCQYSAGVGGMKEGGRNEERATWRNIDLCTFPDGTISPRRVALRDDSARLKRMRRKLFNARDGHATCGPGK